jgi:hypothetical protein
MLYAPSATAPRLALFNLLVFSGSGLNSNSRNLSCPVSLVDRPEGRPIVNAKRNILENGTNHPVPHLEDCSSGCQERVTYWSGVTGCCRAPGVGLARQWRVAECRFEGEPKRLELRIGTFQGIMLNVRSVRLCVECTIPSRDGGGI